jgi:hypothetical protein
MSDVTRLLAAIQRGEPDAAGTLLAQVYAELRALARAKMAREQARYSLARSCTKRGCAWAISALKPAHFFGAAAEAMRRILIERARRKLAAKYGAGAERVDVEEVEIIAPTPKDDELLAVHEALDATRWLNTTRAKRNW